MDLNHQEFIPIIRDEGGAFYFICVKKGENYGKIYLDNEDYQFDFENLYLIADNINEFLDCVIYHEDL
jgi:cell wall assembly regulator SMI1